MGRYRPIYVADDQYLTADTSDVSGGMNSRVNDSRVGENQAVNLLNVDLSEPGRRQKRPGSALIGIDFGAAACWGLHEFILQGDTDRLMVYESTNVREWEGTGNFSAALKNDFTAAQSDIGFVNVKMSGESPDDVCIVQNGTDNAFLFKEDGSATDLGATAGTGSDSPPKSTVMGWSANNRMWVLLNDGAYFSEAYSANYAAAFDTVSDIFRIPVGEERAIITTREAVLIFFGKDAIWTLAPSVTPAPTTDKPVPLVSNNGVVSKRGVVQDGDEIYFFSQDGVRNLKRTVQDKLQLGISYPLSYPLKAEYESIAWASIEKLCSIAWNNLVFFCVPVDGATYANQMWIYNPATQGWSVTSPNELKIGGISKLKVGGEERLYYSDATDGKVYRMWTGTTDNGTDIIYQEETRAYDLKAPLQDKEGGEYVLRCEDGGGIITVSYQIDDNGWVQLGTLDTAGSWVTFPTTFPVAFAETGIIEGKWHLPEGTKWRKIEFKHYNSSDDAIKILSNSLLTLVDQYQSED